MNVSRSGRCITVYVLALVVGCTTSRTEPNPAGVPVAETVPDAVPAEPPKPAPMPAPKPKSKPKPKAKPAAPAALPEPAKPEPPLAALEPPKQLSSDEIVPILGKKVLGPAGEDLGRVVNVLVDEKGRTRAAVIDFGGFLGVGSRKIAVAWDQLTFNPGTGDRPLVLNMTREQIQGAREYKQRSTEQVDVATPPRPGQTLTKPSH